MANINGWGRGTWDEGSWGTALPVEISAPSAATSALGTVSTVAKANVAVTGVSGTCETNVFTLVWGNIDTSQTAGYSDVTTSQTANYTDVDTSQTANYEDIAA